MSTEDRTEWQPGDPVYTDSSGWLRCACGTEFGPGLSVPMACPECGSPMVAREERDEVASGKTIAPNVRPHRWAHATGEHRRTQTHRGTRRYEPASFQPLWILVDDEEIPTDDEIEQHADAWADFVADGCEYTP